MYYDLLKLAFVNDLYRQYRLTVSPVEVEYAGVIDKPHYRNPTLRTSLAFKVNGVRAVQAYEAKRQSLADVLHDENTLAEIYNALMATPVLSGTSLVPWLPNATDMDIIIDRLSDVIHIRAKHDSPYFYNELVLQGESFTTASLPRQHAVLGITYGHIQSQQMDGGYFKEGNCLAPLKLSTHIPGYQNFVFDRNSIHGAISITPSHLWLQGKFFAHNKSFETMVINTDRNTIDNLIPNETVGEYVVTPSKDVWVGRTNGILLLDATGVTRQTHPLSPNEWLVGMCRGINGCLSLLVKRDDGYIITQFNPGGGSKPVQDIHIKTDLTNSDPYLFTQHPISHHYILGFAVDQSFGTITINGVERLEEGDQRTGLIEIDYLGGVHERFSYCTNPLFRPWVSDAQAQPKQRYWKTDTSLYVAFPSVLGTATNIMMVEPTLSFAWNAIQATPLLGIAYTIQSLWVEDEKLMLSYIDEDQVAGIIAVTDPVTYTHFLTLSGHWFFVPVSLANTERSVPKLLGDGSGKKAATGWGQPLSI